MYLQKLDIHRCDNILKTTIKLPIEFLEIYQSGVNDEGLKELNEVKQLKISNCHNLTNEAFKYLSNLNELHLWCCDQLTNEVFKCLPNLKYLNVNLNNSTIELLNY